MISTRKDSTRLVLVVTGLAILGLMGFMVSTEIFRARHVVGTYSAGPREDTWYATDDKVVYESNLLETTTVYMRKGKLWRKEFHIFNPVVADFPATPAQAEIWKHFFAS